ncbi:MAG: hypothetical protein ACXV3T_08590 [Halobacteriota archaeon]
MLPKQPEPITLRSRSARARVQLCTTSGLEILVGRRNVAPFRHRACGGEER